MRRRKKRKDGLLTTGDMARGSQSTLRTVRFYEEAQVLRPAQRSEGGHRLFSPNDLEKLLLVMDMRAAGLSLEEIKTILSIKDRSKTGAEAAQRVESFLDEQTEAMQRRLEALQRLKEDFQQASVLFHKCEYCDNEDTFPSECRYCGVMSNPKTLPRTVRVLWDLSDDDDET
jgi:DNA-binding transcriptional MerR regulator